MSEIIPKKAAAAQPLPRGLKAVAAPKSSKARELDRGPDITTSGGRNTASRPTSREENVTQTKGFASRFLVAMLVSRAFIIT